MARGLLGLPVNSGPDRLLSSETTRSRGYPMNLFHLCPRLIACAAAAFSLSQCVVNPDSGSGSPSASPPTSSSTGAISVLSSIGGTTQTSSCGMVGASALELAVFEGPDHYTTVTSPCTDFQITVTLPEGDYNADATLLDSQSRPVSTTLTLYDLRVISGTNLKVEVDFPMSSTLP